MTTKPQDRTAAAVDYGLKWRNDVTLTVQPDSVQWDQVPIELVDPGWTEIYATERYLDPAPIAKLVAGEPFREGYEPHLVRTRIGLFVLDGHHRVAAKIALDKSFEARVLDVRPPNLPERRAEDPWREWHS